MAPLRFTSHALFMAITMILVQQSNSMALEADKEFMNKFNMLISRFSMECKTFATGASADELGKLNLDQACSRVKSDGFKNNALAACTQEEYDAAVALVCISGSTDGSKSQGSTLNKDKTFLEKWIALLKTFSVKCRNFLAGSSTEPIGDLTHDQACKYVKLDNFKQSVLASCSENEYNGSVKLVCESGSAHIYLSCPVLVLSFLLLLLLRRA